MLLNTVVADLPNPVFSEVSYIVNTSKSTDLYSVVYSTAATVSCQDFQAVLLNSKEYTQINRVLLDFGYSCQNTTVDIVQRLNYNSTNLLLMKTMETIALVKRGICNWSEKISVINSISTTGQMNVTAAFIYDNQLDPDVSVKTSLYQATITFPTYSTPLPSNRSVLNMTDNDLTQSSIGVYFIPYAYGNTLKSKLNDTYNPSNPNIRTLWSITTYFLQDDSSDGFLGSIKGYLAYIIALAAIFLIGIIFLRWWRIRRLREDYPNDLTGNNNIHLHQRASQVDPLPVDIVNALPIKQYEPGLTKNVNCAICLDDFLLGKNDVRVLPCAHGFCVLCIDPWLTQKSTLCPICKWDCLPSEARQQREGANDESAHTVSIADSSISIVTQVHNDQATEQRDTTSHLTAGNSSMNVIISLPDDNPSSSEHIRKPISPHINNRDYNEGSSSTSTEEKERITTEANH
ncbi:hypothetical protein G6F43_009415 [Rhizopus delemar]|nr:hypothetical protein G6F43_009415 [Rhizopus delemar]